MYSTYYIYIYIYTYISLFLQGDLLLTDEEARRVEERLRQQAGEGEREREREIKDIYIYLYIYIYIYIFSSIFTWGVMGSSPSGA